MRWQVAAEPVLAGRIAEAAAVAAGCGAGVLAGNQVGLVVRFRAHANGAGAGAMASGAELVVGTLHAKPEHGRPPLTQLFQVMRHFPLGALPTAESLLQFPLQNPCCTTMP